MKMTLVFVPAGGGEADYQLDFDLPSVPQPGDYVSIRRPDAQGTVDFIVRRTWWASGLSEQRLIRAPRASRLWLVARTRCRVRIRGRTVLDRRTQSFRRAIW
jgi:hypothetical protein